MRVDVAFTPAEAGPAHVAIVVDVMRATSTIAQALASGYPRVLCCREIDDARALREQLGDEAVVGGERNALLIDGFDLGASPRDYLEPRAETAILTGYQGAFAVDDAYCAGRIVQLLGGKRTDAAVASDAIARAYSTAWEGVNARTYGPPGLEDDLRWCTQENTLDVVPGFTHMVGAAAEIKAKAL